MGRKKNPTINQNISKLISLFFLIFVVFFGLSYKNIDTSGLMEVKVSKVVDGDTIELSDGKQIRYIGIDAPEMDEALYDKATDFNQSLINSAKVYLEKDIVEKDKYDRILGYIWVNDKLVNEEILGQGLAFPLFIPPNRKYQDRFIKAFESAQTQDLNLWTKDVGKKVSSYRVYNNW